jgi:hypothetical protein
MKLPALDVEVLRCGVQGHGAEPYCLVSLCSASSRLEEVYQRQLLRPELHRPDVIARLAKVETPQHHFLS